MHICRSFSHSLLFRAKLKTMWGVWGNYIREVGKRRAFLLCTIKVANFQLTLFPRDQVMLLPLCPFRCQKISIRHLLTCIAFKFLDTPLHLTFVVAYIRWHFPWGLRCVLGVIFSLSPYITGLIYELLSDSLSLSRYLALTCEEAIVNQLNIRWTCFVFLHSRNQLLLLIFSLFLSVFLCHINEKVHQFALFVEGIHIVLVQAWEW